MWTPQQHDLNLALLYTRQLNNTFFFSGNIYLPEHAVLYFTLHTWSTLQYSCAVKNVLLKKLRLIEVRTFRHS